MANRNFPNKGNLYAPHARPILVDCSFIVDPTNANGFGIKSLKASNMIRKVTMQAQTAAPPLPPGSPNLGTSSGFAVLANSAISNTGSTVITGDLGIYPGTSVTGFPPGTVVGTQHIADGIAQQAQIDATAAYTDLSTRSSTVIPSALDGQTLTAGVYSFASGAATLAESGNGTLTFNGSATDVFVIQTASTLRTGAGGIPTILLTGGALASNIYWAVGSSATINIGVTSATAEFKGTIIASASITDTQGGTVTGRLIALNAAITFSAATIVNLASPAGPSHIAGTPAPGIIKIEFMDNFQHYLGGFSNLAGTLGTSVTSTTANTSYVITALGTATLAQWKAKGVPTGITPAVGVAFVATATGAIGGGATVAPSFAAGSGVDHIEELGDISKTTRPIPSALNTIGGYAILQTFFNGAVSAPNTDALIELAFYFDDSSVLPGDGA